MKYITVEDIEKYRKKVKVGDVIRLDVNQKNKNGERDLFVPVSVKVTGVYKNFVTTDCAQCRTLKYVDILRGHT